MLIEFLVNEKSQAVIDLPNNQRFPLVQGIQLLEEVNRELLATAKNATIDYFIYFDKEQELPTLEATLNLPTTNGTIVEAIQAPVRDNEEIDSEQAQAFLALFQKNLPRNKRTKVVNREKIKESSNHKKKSERDPSIQKTSSKRNKTAKFFVPIILLGALLLVLGGGLTWSYQSI